jgi:colicin import membrane protein
MFSGDINKKLLRALKKALKGFADDLTAAWKPSAAGLTARQAIDRAAAARAAAEEADRHADQAGRGSAEAAEVSAARHQDADQALRAANQARQAATDTAQNALESQRAADAAEKVWQEKQEAADHARADADKKQQEADFAEKDWTTLEQQAATAKTLWEAKVQRAAEHDTHEAKHAAEHAEKEYKQKQHAAEPARQEYEAKRQAAAQATQQCREKQQAANQAERDAQEKRRAAETLTREAERREEVAREEAATADQRATAAHEADLLAAEKERARVAAVESAQEKRRALAVAAEVAEVASHHCWLLHKAKIAQGLVGAALRSQATLEQTRADLDVVIKEISARFAACASARNTTWKADALDLAREKLCEVISNLTLLSLTRDATSPQLGLLTIVFASEEAAERLTSACQIVDDWAGHWQGACGLEELGCLKKVVCGSDNTEEPGMKGQLAAVEKTAREAATTCDPEKTRKSCQDICEDLTDLHDSYTEAVCLLQRLRLSPEMEPTFVDQVSRYLGRAIYYVAVAFQAQRKVCVVAKSWTEQLVEAWGELGKQIPELKKEVACAAQKNLCGPADLCHDQLDGLTRYAGEGANAARRLLSDPGDAEALARANELLGQFQTQLVELNGKKLRRRAFDGFNRPLALISRVQSGCPEEADCCLLNESQLENLLEKLKPTLAGTGCEELVTRLTTRARQPVLGRRAGTQPVPVAAPAPQQTPQPGGGDDGLRRAPLYLELLPAIEKAASRVVDYVPEPLKPRIRDIASRAPEQTRQLKAEQKAGTLAGSLLAQRLGLQLNENLMVLTAAYAVAQDTAPAAVKATLTEVGQQLNSITQRLTGAPGPQPAAREPACCAGGGNAS